MKIRTFALMAVVLCGLSVAQEQTPEWVDANQTTGLVYAAELLLGDTLVVTARQTDPNLLGEWKLVGGNPFVTIDINTPNEASIAYAPDVEGTEYIKYKTRILLPYKGRVRINTLAFRTRQEPPFSVEWFQITIPPIGEGEPIPW